MNYRNEIWIDEIKKEYIENFKYQEKDKNKIILYYIDKEGDKNIINIFDELFNFIKEVEIIRMGLIQLFHADEKNISINLFSKLKKNIINDPHKNNLTNSNMGNIVKRNIHNNNNENEIIYIKNK